MAIKVNGTTVIDDSRNLSNVGGLKTVNGNSLVGSGNISAGASTTYGAVGTYLIAYTSMGANAILGANSTVSGSGLRHTSSRTPLSNAGAGSSIASNGAGVGGTWRHMNRGKNASSISMYVPSIFVRIS